MTACGRVDTSAVPPDASTADGAIAADAIGESDASVDAGATDSVDAAPCADGAPASVEGTQFPFRVIGDPHPTRPNPRRQRLSG